MRTWRLRYFKEKLLQCAPKAVETSAGATRRAGEAVAEDMNAS